MARFPYFSQTKTLTIHRPTYLPIPMVWKSQCNFSQHFMKIMLETMAIVGQLPLLNRCEPGNKIMRSMLVGWYYVWYVCMITGKAE